MTTGRINQVAAFQRTSRSTQACSVPPQFQLPKQRNFSGIFFAESSLRQHLRGVTSERNSCHEALLNIPSTPTNDPKEPTDRNAEYRLLQAAATDVIAADRLSAGGAIGLASKHLSQSRSRVKCLPS